MTKPFLLYFGCWDRPGHFLYDRQGRTLYNEREVSPLVIPPGALDGSKVFLPQPEVPGQGRLTHVIRGGHCVTVLAWWDRTFDARAACNAAIQCDGWDTADGLWWRFSQVYSQLAPKLTKPELL